MAAREAVVPAAARAAVARVAAGRERKDGGRMEEGYRRRMEEEWNDGGRTATEAEASIAVHAAANRRRRWQKGGTSAKTRERAH